MVWKGKNSTGYCSPGYCSNGRGDLTGVAGKAILILMR
uniref:Uncharacterized protein n=1 Tax=Arundo donax TaxID=35708 RepID=A0A0A8ZJG0_ARUDO